MRLGAIWRYPVKSMAGELLAGAEIGALGVHGDRVLQVRDRHGKIVTARSHPALLAHKATLSDDDEVLIDGLPWRHPRVASALEALVGHGAALSTDDGSERFDARPLTVTTDGTIAAFGRDPRRLRANLIIEGVEGLAERQWPGRVLRIGSVRLAVRELCERCVIPTYDPDTQERQPQVLTDIRSRFDGKLALLLDVLAVGPVRAGDEAVLEAP